jgi:hypothetical protein
MGVIRNDAAENLESSQYETIVFIPKDGSAPYARVVLPETLEDEGYMFRDDWPNVYLENEAPPVGGVEADWEDELNHAQALADGGDFMNPADVPAETRLEGFLPVAEWKEFRENIVFEQVFHRKEERSFPVKRIIIAMLLIGAVVVVATQFGLI